MSKKTIETYLETHPFFSGFEKEYLGFLSKHVAERDVAAGRMLFRQGERADYFYIVRTGQVSVEIPAITGPSLRIQTLGAGQVLGWSWLISPYQWDFQAQAVEATELLEFDAGAILKRCEEDYRFGYELLQAFTVLMSERLHSARRKMMEQWVPSGFA